jgi:hypothetical protein
MTSFSFLFNKRKKVLYQSDLGFVDIYVFFFCILFFFFFSPGGVFVLLRPLSSKKLLSRNLIWQFICVQWQLCITDTYLCKFHFLLPSHSRKVKLFNGMRAKIQKMVPFPHYITRLITGQTKLLPELQMIRKLLLHRYSIRS